MTGFHCTTLDKIKRLFISTKQQLSDLKRSKNEKDDYPFNGRVSRVTGLTSCSQDASHENPAQPANYQAEGVVSLSLPEIAKQLQSKQITSVELVQQYLDRIDAMNPQGLQIVAISLNPNALEQAKASDALAASGEFSGPLHGVPILLKDNIEAAGMPTTAGAYAFERQQAETALWLVG